MKPTTLLIAALTTVSATASWLGGDDQVAIKEDDLSVPGQNPLTYCQKPENDLFTIQKVDLNPNPPLPGKNLTITVEGVLAKPVENKAHVNLEVKYGFIKILTQDVDLCEQAGNIDLSCPIAAGPVKVTKEVSLPQAIPPGTYSVLADVLTGGGDPITCLQAVVSFHTGSQQGSQEL